MAGWDGQGSTRAWRKKRAFVLARDLYVCQIKGPRCIKKATHADHIISKKDGGSDDITNLRAACHVCNEGRRDTITNPSPRPRTQW